MLVKFFPKSWGEYETGEFILGLLVDVSHARSRIETVADAERKRNGDIGANEDRVEGFVVWLSPGSLTFDIINFPFVDRMRRRDAAEEKGSADLSERPLTASVSFE